MSEMRLVVVGAAGRMGRILIKAVAETQGCRLVGAIERSGSEALEHDAGLLAGIGLLDVNVTDDPLPVFAEADGVIDFTARPQRSTLRRWPHRPVSSMWSGRPASNPTT